MIEHYAVNTVGKDFACGDVHGYFFLLEKALAKVNFDPEKDRLFGVGDLVDRGPESHLVLDWLAKPWFHTVRGNHEQMAMDYYHTEQQRADYLKSGGHWFIDLDHKARQPFAEAFAALPLGIEIETQHGLVGVVHAECPGDSWPHFHKAAGNIPMRAWMKQCAMWERRKERLGDTYPVKGVHAVYVGHTPQEEIKVLGNVHYIDGGVYRQKGHLNVVHIN